MDIGSKAGTRNVEFWASGGYICGCGRPNSLVFILGTNIAKYKDMPYEKTLAEVGNSK